MLYNAVDTESSNMLQERKQNAKTWLNLGCYFLSIRGRLFVFSPLEARTMNIYLNHHVETRGKLFVKVLSNINILFFS